MVNGILLCQTHLVCLPYAGMRFAPPGSKRLIYFIDDANMSFKDKYDTQSAVELMRQSIDYGGW